MNIFALIVLVMVFIINPPIAAQAIKECPITTDPEKIITKPDSTALAIGTRITYAIQVTDPGTYNVFLKRGVGPGNAIGDFSFRNLTPNTQGFLINSSGLPDLVIDGTKATAGAFKAGPHIIEVERQGASGNYCIAHYEILTENSASQINCSIQGPTDPNSITEIIYSGTLTPEGSYKFLIPQLNKEHKFSVDSSGQIGTQNLGIFNPGTYTVKLQKEGSTIIQSADGSAATIPIWEDTNCTIQNLQIDSITANPKPDTTPVDVGNGTPVGPVTVVAVPSCKDDPTRCASAGGKSCDSSDPNNPGISTAIGCIHTSPIGFVKDMLTFVTGIGGGVAFLMMLIGAFQMLTSAGNPDALSAGKDRFTSAIIGLLVVIFAVLLLQIFGFDILRIPGFGK